MKSEWTISCKIPKNKPIYTVYRLIDRDGEDCEENREYPPENYYTHYRDRIEAEWIADRLNRGKEHFDD